MALDDFDIARELLLIVRMRSVLAVGEVAIPECLNAGVGAGMSIRSRAIYKILAFSRFVCRYTKILFKLTG